MWAVRAVLVCLLVLGARAGEQPTQVDQNRPSALEVTTKLFSPVLESRNTTLQNVLASASTALVQVESKVGAGEGFGLMCKLEVLEFFLTATSLFVSTVEHAVANSLEEILIQDHLDNNYLRVLKHATIQWRKILHGMNLVAFFRFLIWVVNFIQVEKWCGLIDFDTPASHSDPSDYGLEGAKDAHHPAAEEEPHAEKEEEPHTDKQEEPHSSLLATKGGIADKLVATFAKGVRALSPETVQRLESVAQSIAMFQSSGPAPAPESHEPAPDSHEPAPDSESGAVPAPSEVHRAAIGVFNRPDIIVATIKLWLNVLGLVYFWQNYLSYVELEYLVTGKPRTPLFRNVESKVRDDVAPPIDMDKHDEATMHVLHKFHKKMHEGHELIGLLVELEPAINVAEIGINTLGLANTALHHDLVH